jgi:hypothetical protein
MLEGSSGTPPIGRSSFFQFGVSAVESRNNLTQRIQSGLPLSELHSSGQLNSELPIAIDYMVDLAAYELDASTLELVIEAWPAAEYAKTEPETRLTVKVSNRGGQAPHEYSISSVNLERILFNEREGKLQ